MKLDIKYGNTTLERVTSVGTITYATANKFMDNNLVLDVVEGDTDVSDATVTAPTIVTGYSAYGSSRSKITGTISLYDGSFTPVAELNPLCFTAKTSGSTIGMALTGTSTISPTFQYSTDKDTWTTFTPGSTTITLAAVGDKVYFKGNNSSGVSESANKYYFTMTGSIDASGSIMALIDDGLGVATTIPNTYCFANMFSGCDSLQSPPNLVATTLTDHCYDSMFNNCTNMIIADATSTGAVEWKIPTSGTASGNYAMTNMFAGCLGNRSTDSPNFNGIQKTYYVGGEVPVEYPYLCFTANTANSTVTCPKTFEYSTDGETWSTASTSSAITLSSVGDKIYVRRGSVALPGAWASFGTFVMTGSISASGNVMSLVDNNCESVSLTIDAIFQNLFKNCTSLTTPPSLPATTLSTYCYSCMFQGCTNLTTAPSLPASTLADGCYETMFNYCESLHTIAKIPATAIPAWTCSMMYATDGGALKVYSSYSASHPYAWRVPTTGTGTCADGGLYEVFQGHGGDAPTTPVINTTYYLEYEPV